MKAHALARTVCVLLEASGLLNLFACSLRLCNLHFFLAIPTLFWNFNFTQGTHDFFTRTSSKISSCNRVKSGERAKKSTWHYFFWLRLLPGTSRAAAIFFLLLLSTRHSYFTPLRTAENDALFQEKDQPHWV